MLGLRHIWTTSIYFSSDEKMQILLHKLSYIFTEKVKSVISLNLIFKHSPTEAYEMSIKCSKLLMLWKANYMHTRDSIEKSGFGSRWEFDKNVLFDNIDHFVRICNDIASISLSFIEFENIFEKHLKSIVYNPEEVSDILIRVSYL